MIKVAWNSLFAIFIGVGVYLQTGSFHFVSYFLM
jgi:hypothetical protein